MRHVTHLVFYSAHFFPLSAKKMSSIVRQALLLWHRQRNEWLVMVINFSLIHKNALMLLLLLCSYRCCCCVAIVVVVAIHGDGCRCSWCLTCRCCCFSSGSCCRFSCYCCCCCRYYCFYGDCCHCSYRYSCRLSCCRCTVKFCITNSSGPTKFVGYNRGIL